MKKPFLFIGLDYEEPYKVAEFARELNEVKSNQFGYKLNLDFLLNSLVRKQYEPFEEVLSLGKPIFADLKMWNGRRTMCSIFEALAERKIAYANVYTLADKPFLEAIKKTLEGTDTQLLTVTVLTHYNDRYCYENFGCSMKEAVRKFSQTAYDSGCDGIILPGTMLSEVRHLPLKNVLVPAVRPDWYDKTGENYQKQESSLKEAIQGGANLLVCSSPIRKSKDRKEALLKTLDEMII